MTIYRAADARKFLAAQRGHVRPLTPDDDDREALLDEAVRAGKFSANRKPFYRAQYDKAPARTRKVIDKLVAIAPDGTLTLPTDDSYPARWLSGSERRRIAAAKGKPINVPSGTPEAPGGLPPMPGGAPPAPGGAPPAPGSARTPTPSGDTSYPAHWLTAPERARIMMAGKGDPPPTISVADDR